MFLRVQTLLCCLLVALVCAPRARAQQEGHDVWVLPTEVLEPAPSVDLQPLAQRLDAVLLEAVRDFGMTPLLGRAPISRRDEAALTELGRQASVLSPQLGVQGSDIELRLVLVPHAS
ncbi:MAG TPA: hypothetical protein VNN80_32365, partial [Polyangiaceae bacterium]|nr:hypothetical protein [Polyangiaceae bacterium]